MPNHRSRSRSPHWSGAAALALMLGLWPIFTANAQIALPGAFAPAQEGSVAPPEERRAAKAKAPKRRGTASGAGDGGAVGSAIVPKPPKEDGLFGKQLHLDGARSIMEIRRVDGQLQISRLTLLGDSIGHSGESCRVEVTGTPLKLDSQESDSGLHKYRADFAACPFDIEVLDGAILVSNQSGACELKAADCRVDMVGLWGPGEAEFDPKHAKEMLDARARVEKTVRADFRELYTKNMKDKSLRDLIVRDQAGFSAHREEICRSYAHEDEFGYCALRVTEARALTLGVQLATGMRLRGDIAPDETASKNLKNHK